MAAATLVAHEAGCSSSSGEGLGAFGSTAGGGSAGAGASSSSGGANLSGSGGGSTIFNVGGSGPSRTGGSVIDGSCAGVSQAAEVITEIVEVPIYEYRPVGLYLMQDRSSSMVGVAGDPNGWPDATGAITAFVSDPASQGLDVALGFFPPTTTNAGACDGSDCAPPVVPFGPLPGNAQPIINAMGTATPPVFPPLFTPTECALRGATAECARYQSNTQIQCVVVLVSDGEPTVCNTNTPALAQIAADALNNWNVLTFTVGMQGANFGVLDAIAQAGGSDCDPNGPGFACDVRAGQAAFIDALNQIRQTVTRIETRTEMRETQVDCAWSIPSAPEGETFDKNKVNVEFQSDNTGRQQIGRVPGASECASYGGGWFFDDPNNPTTVQVCDETCSVIQGASGVQVDVLFGCDTVFAVPR